MAAARLGLVLLIVLAVLLCGCGSDKATTKTTTPTLSSITLTAASMTPALGTSTQLSAVGKNGDGSTATLANVTWSSSNTAVATVDANGVVTTKSQGTATITVSSGGVTATITITVGSPTLVSVTLAPTNASVALGNGQDFTVTGTMTDGSTNTSLSCTWSSSNTAVATITNGVITTKGQGTTTIGVTCGSVSTSTTLTVAAPAPKSLALDFTTVTLDVAATKQLTATLTLTDNSTQNVTSQVTWQTSAPSVASVAAGLVTALGAGSSQISALYQNGALSASASITVSAPQEVGAVTIGNYVRNIRRIDEPVTLTATVAGDSGNRGVTWTLTADGQPCEPDCGTLSNATSTTVVYTPPNLVLAAPMNVPTITATSVADNTKSATDIFSITNDLRCGSGNESILNGQYAFMLNGFDNQGNMVLGGSVTMDGNGRFTDSHVTGLGGHIGGDVGPGNGNSIHLNASTYSVGPDNQGCAFMWLPGDYYPTLPGAAIALRFTVKSDGSKGSIIQFENPDTTAYIASGGIWKQDPAAFTQFMSGGNYVLGYIGTTYNEAGLRWAAGGAYYMDTFGHITNGEFDLNTNGVMVHQTGKSGYLSTWDDYHMVGTVVESVGDYPYAGNLISDCYVISGREAACIAASTNSTWLFTGTMRRRAGFPDVTSLNAPSVFRIVGKGPSPSVGILNPDGNGNISIRLWDMGEGVNEHTLNCSYSVATNGRTLPGGTDCQAGVPILYLTGQNTGFLIGTNTNVDFGEFEPRAAGPFSKDNLAGTYVVMPPVVGSHRDVTQEGNVLFESPGNEYVNGHFDVFETSYSSQYRSPWTSNTIVNADGTYSMSDGSFGIIISDNKVVFLNWMTAWVFEK